jgi:serine/threonine-protein kinase
LNLQCTAEPPALSEDVRRGLPKGVEELVFHLLEKAPEDRPYLAEDVVARLEPFIPAGGTVLGAGVRPTQPSPSPRARPSLGATAERSVSAERGSQDRLPEARGSPPANRSPAPSAAPAGSAAAGPTLPSEGEAGSPPAKIIEKRADTIALLEKAERPREVSTTVAVGIIVALSLFAGVAAYAIRATSTPDAAKSAPTATEKAKASPAGSGKKKQGGW